MDKEKKMDLFSEIEPSPMLMFVNLMGAKMTSILILMRFWV